MDTFAIAVANKEYKKLSYDMWRTMINSINYAEDHDNFRITFVDMSINIYGFRDRWLLDRNDKSFGDFLYNTFNTDNPININENNNIKKENNIMNFNFDFGPVNPSLVRMSMYGLAVKNKMGTWVSFNADAGEIVDVDVLNFDGAKFLYRMPVAIKDIAIGDVVVHNGAPMFVIATPNSGKILTVIDTINSERKDIMLPRSPFGFNFATKVVNFLGNMMTGATADNPFGNMWMLMALSGDNKDMLPLMLMSGMNGGSMDPNMLMFLALSGDKNGNDMLPWLLMSQSMNAAPTNVCKCGGSCHEAQDQN